MKICIFSRTFYPTIGGLERIAEIVATAATEMGHDVEVLTDTLDAAGDSSFSFSVHRDSRHVGRVRIMKRADVVLFMNVSLPGLFAALHARSPIVLSHHGVYNGSGIRSKFFGCLKRQLTRFYPNIAVSEYVGKHIPGRCTVIPNAYDSSLFGPSQKIRDRDFVFCGRLVSDKGAFLCLSAFANVRSMFPSTTLTVVGDGPERQWLERHASSLGLANSVLFTGALREAKLVSELQRHACLVVSSIWDEPFGIVALEGIACCETVIATCRGGLPEALGNCGLIVDATLDGLTGAMTAIAHALQVRVRLPGHPDDSIRDAHLSRHTPHRICQKYLEVLADARDYNSINSF